MNVDVSQIVQKQRDFFQTGATRSLEFRRKALERLYAAVREMDGAIGEALQQDLNKQPTEAYMCETGMVLDECRYHLRHLRGWMREHRAATPLAQFYGTSFTAPEPYGVVFIAAPWNYPVHLCLLPLIGAISGGNCVVLKPSAQAPASSRVLEQLIAKTFDPAYITVAACSGEEADALLEERWDYIFFTGSPAVGKKVMAAAAKHLTPVTLELGGKSPVIVDHTANLPMAARRVAMGKVLNAGQICLEPDYLLIEASVRDRFLQEYRRALDEFFPKGDHAQMVHIINDKHFQRLLGLLEGQKIVLGGGYDARLRLLEPTVLVDVGPSSPVMTEEIFGPILPVLTWETLEEAIAFVCSRPKPLALYLFTASRSTQRRVLDTCSFGGGCINDTLAHVATSHMGFGGVGTSGMGQYHGKHSFDTFTHTRSILKKATWVDLPLRYPPYSHWKDRLIRRFLR